MIWYITINRFEPSIVYDPMIDRVYLGVYGFKNGGRRYN